MDQKKEKEFLNTQMVWNMKGSIRIMWKKDKELFLTKRIKLHIVDRWKVDCQMVKGGFQGKMEVKTG